MHSHGVVDVYNRLMDSAVIATWREKYSVTLILRDEIAVIDLRAMPPLMGVSILKDLREKQIHHALIEELAKKEIATVISYSQCSVLISPGPDYPKGLQWYANDPCQNTVHLHVIPLTR